MNTSPTTRPSAQYAHVRVPLWDRACSVLYAALDRARSRRDEAEALLLEREFTQCCPAPDPGWAVGGIPIGVPLREQGPPAPRAAFPGFAAPLLLGVAALPPLGHPILPPPIPAPGGPQAREPRWGSVEEAAAALGISRDTLDRQRKEQRRRGWTLPGDPLVVGTGAQRRRERWDLDRVREWAAAWEARRSEPPRPAVPRRPRRPRSTGLQAGSLPGLPPDL